MNDDSLIAAAGAPENPIWEARWVWSVPLVALGLILIAREWSHRRHVVHEGHALTGYAGLGPRERAELRDLIARTS